MQETITQTLPPRAGQLRGFANADRIFSSVLLGISAALLFGVAAITTYQVIARFIFSEPSEWSEPLARLMMVWMVYLGAAAALRHGALVGVNILLERLGKPAQKVLLSLISAATVGLMVVVVVAGVEIMDVVRNQNLAGLEISISWAYAAIPVGGALSCLAVVARLIEVWAGNEDITTVEVLE
ncbi:TRAP transporter small permease [Polaromonas sp.]|uniref:TRAP transporter small permease n=1 Tax=Polaromonas sp. TaxID=1869339 RepID=UPI001DA6CFE6|nr:TRAP transporter small permease [Polaromonas sp.]MBT9476170.1 TRAP transporter small permease [Polaromonas sp.]